MSSKVWDEITYPFPNFNGATAEVWEWMSNSIPHFMTDVIIYLYSNCFVSMLVKGTIGVGVQHKTRDTMGMSTL